jgi:hypothetical protein
VDQSELYWNEAYKGSATAAAAATVPGAAGVITLLVSALNAEGTEELFSNSTAFWQSANWISHGNLELESLLRMNQSHYIDWNVHNVFYYENSSYVAATTNENLNGDEIWYGNATGKYGANGYYKWYCSVRMHAYDNMLCIFDARNSILLPVFILL